MSKFTPMVVLEVEFKDDVRGEGEGEPVNDVVHVEAERFKKKDILALTPYMKQNDEGDFVMSFSDQIEMSEVMSNVLPKRIKKFSGLKDANGAEISLEDAIEESYFMTLIIEIITQLMDASTVKEKKVKKLESTSGSDTKESAS